MNIIKRAVSFFLCAAVLIGIVPSNVAYADDSALRICVAESAEPGSTVSAEVIIPENLNASLIQFAISYDDGKLELVNAQAGDIFSSLGSPTINADYSGKVYFNWDTINSSITAAGSILDLTFRVKNNAAGSAEIRIDTGEEFLFQDLNFADVSPAVVNSRINIQSVVLVSQITVSLSPATIQVGQQATASCVITPDDASNKAVSWSVVSGENHISIDADGTVTGLSSGTATIRATALDGSGIYGENTLIVEEPLTDNQLALNESNFPDENFRQYLIENFASGKDYLTKDEVDGVTEIDCSGLNVSSVAGIELFQMLTKLNCRNNSISELDISCNSKLKMLLLDNNQLSAIDVTNNPELNTLYISGNNLTEIDVSNNGILSILDVSKNNLSEICVNRNAELTYLGCSNNQITSIDVSDCPLLRWLYVDNNHLKVLDLSNNHDHDNGMSATGIVSNNYSPQTVHLEASLQDGIQQINMGRVVGKNYLSRVSAVSGGTYNSSTGIMQVNSDTLVYRYQIPRTKESGTTYYLEVTATITQSRYIHVAAIPSTCSVKGNTEYWYDSETGRYYSDDSYSAEIQETDTVLPLKEHTFADAVCIYCGMGEDNCYHGKSGDTSTWKLSSDGILTVSGTGVMWDMSSSSSNEWRQHALKIKKVVIEDGITSVGGMAFYRCSNLTDVLIADSVKTIGTGAFCECSSMETIVLPNSITEIKTMAFSQCQKLVSVQLPERLGIIGDGAFQLNSVMDRIVIPLTVTSIGRSAFAYCTKLSEIVFTSNSQPTIGSYAFSNVSATAYYPSTWTTPTDTYGGNITWNAIHTVTLTVSSDGNGNSVAPLKILGSNLGGNKFQVGETATLQATAVPGYSFEGWFANDVLVSNSLEYNFTVSDTCPLNYIAKYTPNASVRLSVQGHEGKFKVNGKKQYSAYTNLTLAGSQIAVSVTDADNGFLYWKNGGNRIVSRKPDYTFTVITETDIFAVYAVKDTNVAVVQFITDNDQLVKSITCDINDVTREDFDIDVPSGPSKVGYQFLYWTLDGEIQITSATLYDAIMENTTDVIVLRPYYRQSEEQLTITVYLDGNQNPSLSKTVRKGDAVTVTAPAVVNGKNFSHWSSDIDGQIVLSYNEQYFTQVTRNTELYANYSTSSSGSTEMPTIVLSNVFQTVDGSTNKVSFAFTRSIPDGYDLLEHGVIYCKTDSAETMNEATMIIGADGVKKGVGANTEKNGVNNVHLNVTGMENVKVAMRGYIIVSDRESGNTTTIYSAVTKTSFNELAQ
ncbi:MAG: leucine-rich repeat protein [Phocaeicola sp.]